jgi:hypothetical protein
MERSRENTVTKKLELIRSEPKKRVEEGSYRVEFSIEGIDLAYQFKVWNKSPNYMCFLIEEKSDILSSLRVGGTLNMKYYHTDSIFPSDYLDTVIQHVTKKDQGRFKGHYIVGLEIIRSQNSEKTH